MKLVKTTSRLAALALAGAAVAFAQMPEGFLEVLICKVKPDKQADFDALVKKMADANRRHKKGDLFMTLQTEFGEGNTVTFVSTRANYAAVEAGQAAYGQAMLEALGARAAEQFERDFQSCLSSSRAELRRRRWDLSSNTPADTAAHAKLVGESRWIRTVAVRVRPGRTVEFETQARMLKNAMEKNPGTAMFVSQGVGGQSGTVFYFSTLQPSLAAFDSAQPSTRELMGEEGYRAFQKASEENVESIETTISRFLPDLSNPPKEVAAVSPEFWSPKPAAESAPAPKMKAKRAAK